MPFGKRAASNASRSAPRLDLRPPSLDVAPVARVAALRDVVDRVERRAAALDARAERVRAVAPTTP
jgi:hypothetical protein